MIHVGWMANTFVGRNSSGTARAQELLIKGLLKSHSADLRMSLICNKKTNLALINQDIALQKLKVIELPQVKGNFLASSRQYYAAKKVMQDSLDVLHFMNPRQYPYYHYFPAKSFVSTFHAGGDVTAPTDKFIISQKLYNYVGQSQNKHLFKVVADSPFAKQEIIEAYNINANNIEIIPLGTDHLWNLIETKNLINDCYILIVGRWQKYKNVHSILKALNKFGSTLTKKYRIVLLGNTQGLGRDLVITELNLFASNQIIIKNFASEIELKSLYANASLVIHPSINEGFGWPAFEAYGEGARLLVHIGTPADDYLGQQPGVMSANLIAPPREIMNSIIAALTLPEQNIMDRRNYLKKIGATWEKMVENYFDLYVRASNL